MIVQNFEPEHLVEKHGRPIELEGAFGFTMRNEGGGIHAILVAYLHPDEERCSEVWASFDSMQPVPPLAHRYAIKVREALREAGIECVHATADPDIPRSGEWLERLGFVPGTDGIWRLFLCHGSDR